MGQACAGRVALVTGASRGIGKAIATRLGAEGASVAVVGRTAAPGEGTLGSLEETVATLESAGARALPITHDLADPSLDRSAIVDRVEAELGPVDILVNNAAGGGYQLLNEWTDDQVGEVFELN